MNDKTKVMYNLARMYEYAADAVMICQQNNNNYEKVIEDMVTKHAVNMCIVQLGEHAARIRDVDPEFYRDQDMKLFQVKGMRDRITHSYGDVDYKIVKSVLKSDIPQLKDRIEEYVHPEVIRNPYVLHEIEYDDYMKSLQNEIAVESPMKQCMKRTAAKVRQPGLDQERER